MPRRLRGRRRAGRQAVAADPAPGSLQEVGVRLAAFHAREAEDVQRRVAAR